MVHVVGLPNLAQAETVRKREEASSSSTEKRPRKPPGSLTLDLHTKPRSHFKLIREIDSAGPDSPLLLKNHDPPLLQRNHDEHIKSPSRGVVVTDPTWTRPTFGRSPVFLPEDQETPRTVDSKESQNDGLEWAPSQELPAWRHAWWGSDVVASPPQGAPAGRAPARDSWPVQQNPINPQGMKPLPSESPRTQKVSHSFERSRHHRSVRFSGTEDLSESAGEFQYSPHTRGSLKSCFQRSREPVARHQQWISSSAEDSFRTASTASFSGSFSTPEGKQRAKSPSQATA